jgi:6-phosphogluconolactonase
MSDVPNQSQPATKSSNLFVYPDLNALSQAAAALFLKAALASVAQHGRCQAALSGGSTPRRLFQLLAQPPYQTAVPWAHTHLFWADERCVPPDHEESNYGQARLLLLDHVPLPPGNIHRIKGELEAAAAAADYRRQLQALAQPPRAWTRLDLALLGLGDDGHTASLFPGPIPAEEKTLPVMAVTADYQGRPANRVTLTPLLLNRSAQIVFMVVGESKAEAVAAVLHGPRQPEKWPAQRIRPENGPENGRLRWLLDKAAATKIDQW